MFRIHAGVLILQFGGLILHPYKTPSSEQAPYQTHLTLTLTLTLSGTLKCKRDCKID